MPEDPLENKSKSKNLIFILVGIALLLAVLGLAAMFIFNNSDNSNNSTQTPSNNNSNQSNATAPSSIILANLGDVSFGPYNQGTGMSGDFVFAKDAAVSEMTIFPFGQEICEQGSCKTLPELGFQGLKLGTKVTAVAAGKVVEVREQGDNDFAVSTIFDGTSTALNYDHLANVKVKVNDTVEAGDILGEVVPYGSGTYGRFEIMLKEVASDNTATYLCPMNYLVASVKTKLTADLKQFFTDWNTFYGKTVHDLSAMSPAGCLKPKLTETEVGL